MSRESSAFFVLAVFSLVIMGGWIVTANSDNQSIKDLVKLGADPIDAKCAIRPSALICSHCLTPNRRDH